jgi:hypothetical protein
MGVMMGEEMSMALELFFRGDLRMEKMDEPRDSALSSLFRFRLVGLFFPFFSFSPPLVLGRNCSWDADGNGGG